MIKETPILFSTPMVDAILNGTKIMTRRTKGLAGFTDIGYSAANGGWMGNHPDHEMSVKIKCPYGNVGDLLWVRETFKIVDNKCIHKAGHWNTDAKNWKPCIHMKKVDARIWLKLAVVKIERLQNITEDDAIGEGVEECDFCTVNNLKTFRLYGYANAVTVDGPVESFKSLWININGAESWDENPYVWVLKFRTLQIKSQQ